MRRKIILLIVIIAIGTVVQPVAGADNYPEDCDEAPLIETPTTISGTIDVSSDEDKFRVEVQRGDYISVRAMPGQGADNFVISHPPNPEINFRNESGTVEFVDGNVYDYERNIESGVEGTYEIWPQSDGVVCFQIDDAGNPESLPYNWRLSLAETDPQPPEFQVASDDLQDRVETLESRVRTQQQRIDALQTLLDARNQTVREQNETITELQSQSRDGDVSINVTVSPVNSEQAFVSGDSARVEVAASGVDVTDVMVEYGSGIYEVGASGTVEIPLAEIGEQSLTVRTGDTSETTTITVVESAQQTVDQTNGEIASGNGPGFGITMAVLAVLTWSLLVRRR